MGENIPRYRVSNLDFTSSDVHRFHLYAVAIRTYLWHFCKFVLAHSFKSCLICPSGVRHCRVLARLRPLPLRRVVVRRRLFTMLFGFPPFELAAREDLAFKHIFNGQLRSLLGKWKVLDTVSNNAIGVLYFAMRALP